MGSCPQKSFCQEFLSFVLSANLYSRLEPACNITSLTGGGQREIVDRTSHVRVICADFSGYESIFPKNKGFQSLVGTFEMTSLDCADIIQSTSRAAAHSKLNNHTDAIRDCEEALTIDPTYSKAYGRKGYADNRLKARFSSSARGMLNRDNSVNHACDWSTLFVLLLANGGGFFSLAHSALNEHSIALQCYQKALELDPGNSSYQQNIEIAEQKVRELVRTWLHLKHLLALWGLSEHGLVPNERNTVSALIYLRVCAEF